MGARKPRKVAPFRLQHPPRAPLWLSRHGPQRPPSWREYEGLERGRSPPQKHSRVTFPPHRPPPAVQEDGPSTLDAEGAAACNPHQVFQTMTQRQKKYPCIGDPSPLNALGPTPPEKSRMFLSMGSTPRPDQSPHPPSSPACQQHNRGSWQTLVGRGGGGAAGGAADSGARPGPCGGGVAGGGG